MWTLVADVVTLVGVGFFTALIIRVLGRKIDTVIERINGRYPQK